MLGKNVACGSVHLTSKCMLRVSHIASSCPIWRDSSNAMRDIDGRYKTPAWFRFSQ